MRLCVKEVKLISLKIFMVTAFVLAFILSYEQVNFVSAGANRKFLSGFIIALLLGMQRQHLSGGSGYSYPPPMYSSAPSYPSQPSIFVIPVGGLHSGY